MAKIIWIDLGTTNSAIAFMEGWEAKIIPNTEWNRTTPSIVAVNKSWEIIVGTPAKRQSITNPLWTIYSAKRLIGRKFDEVTAEIEHMPFKTKKWSDGGVLIEFNWKDIRPEEISAHVLSKLKRDREKYIWDTVTEAVITVPAYFNDDQRQATINAWKIAWLTVKRIVNEPTARALSYGAWKGKNEKIAVYDLWGWTFDISVLELSEEWTFEVLATNWDTHLGWDNFDEKLVSYIVDEFKKDQWVDLKNDPMALQRVRDEAERAKKELSTTTNYEVNLPYITVDANGPKSLLVNISRAKFEEMITDLVESTLEPSRKVLEDSWLRASELDQVLLIGWSTRVPLVQKKVEEFFGKKPNTGVNPDESVAMGARVQAGIIGWDVTDVLLLDVTPLTLSIETMWGIATPMIERNTTIPSSKSETFSTRVDNQPSVEIHVLQWERKMAIDNKSLGKFMLDGIASAPRWVPQIEVTFDIDANGVLNVRALDKWTGKEQHITIQWSTGMSDDEVEKLVKERETQRARDEQKAWVVESKNNRESTLYQAEKTIADNSDKISDDDKKEAQDKIKSLKDELAKSDPSKDDLESKTKDLSDTMMKIGQAIYANAGASSDSGGSDASNPWDDDIEDADIEADNKDTTRV